MNKFAALGISILLVCVLSTPVHARVPGQWSGTSAQTLAEGRIEVGLFGPLKYGLRDHVELSAHPGWMLLMPHVAAKVSWQEGENWRFATRHEVVYPTLLLRTLSREGAGGVLPSTTRVPQIVSLHNDLLWSLWLAEDHLLSSRLGVSLSPRFGTSELPLIELPVVYARTASYHTLLTARMGVGFEGILVGKLGYHTDVDVFILPGLDGNFALEHGLRAIWSFSQNFRAYLGYKMIYGAYPFGGQFHMLPLLDLAWGWD